MAAATRWATKVDPKVLSRLSAAAKLAETVGIGKKRKQSRRPAWKVEDEVQRRLAAGDWEGAGVRVLVALYVLCHLQVYGVRPAELDCNGTAGKKARIGAESSARRVLDKEFGGDPSKMVAFMHWAWKGEQRREAYAKDKGYERRRMSWRVQFSAELLTDYRVHALRGQK